MKTNFEVNTEYTITEDAKNIYILECNRTASEIIHTTSIRYEFEKHRLLTKLLYQSIETAKLLEIKKIIEEELSSRT